MSNQVSDPRLPEQCQLCVPSHEVRLKLNQIVVGYSHSICATIAVAYHAHRSPLEIAVYGSGWWLTFFSGSVQNTFQYNEH